MNPRNEIRNLKLTIQYDGTNFHGWQMQPRLRTVQGTLTKVLEKILDQKIRLTGAGRTDTGVHALRQVANFECHSFFSTEKIKDALNSILHKDIHILSTEQVDSDFHARFSAVSREYRYQIGTTEESSSPFQYKYFYHLRHSVDIEKLERATNLLLGEHDFSAFSKQDTELNNHLCSVTRAEWINTKFGINLEIIANRFLHQMVRRIVGTLLEVGQGNLTITDIRHILDSKDNQRTSKLAPACGLFLVNVNY